MDRPLRVVRLEKIERLHSHTHVQGVEGGEGLFALKDETFDL